MSESHYIESMRQRQRGLFARLLDALGGDRKLPVDISTNARRVPFQSARAALPHGVSKDMLERFAGFKRMYGVPNDGAPVVIVSANGRASSEHIGWIRATGRDVLCYNDFDVATEFAIANSGGIALMMIEIDGLGGIEAVFDRLRRLRDRAPAVPLAVLSSNVRSNNFSSDRLAICDVTLRVPVTLAALELAFSDAKENNLQWQRRALEMRHANF